MASFLRAARPPPRRAEWSVDDCALFAARKEFELLKLLSTNKKALATARRLGLFHIQPQPHPPAAAEGGAAARAAAALGNYSLVVAAASSHCAQRAGTADDAAAAAAAATTATTRSRHP